MGGGGSLGMLMPSGLARRTEETIDMDDSGNADLHRARSVPELWQVMSRFSSAEGMARGRAFAPRPSDVFIATYPKCGTTLMQQIVHGLRTHGDMDFEDISGVVPWLELALDCGMDPTHEQRADPRAFKTHLDWEGLPKGGKAIYLLREPEATLVSFYHFFSGWFFEPGALDLETFALEFVLAREGAGDYWTHLVSWWPHRKEPDVLYLFYEDVVRDLVGTVRLVAEFIGVETGDDRLEVATRQAGLDFMRRYPDRWEDRLLRQKRNHVMGLPATAGSTKVRPEGAVHSVEEMSESVRIAWRARWREVVEPVTGCASYEELRRQA
jgi:hypothetical protein